jgi:hypothetical protein
MPWRAAPKVTLTLEFNVPTPEGGWTWKPAPEHSKAGEEHVITEQDVSRVLTTYGVIVAQMLVRQGPPRFRLVAHSKCTGKAVAVYPWKWNADLGRYAPDGDPWVVWDAEAEARYLAENEERESPSLKRC